MNSTGTKLPVAQRLLAAAVAGASLITMLASPASAAGDKCRATVAKESAKLTQAIAKTLQKCEEGVLGGKITPPCPDAKALGSINKAKGKLGAALTKSCAADAVGEFALGRCPAADGGTGPGTCTNILITDLNKVADCLSCLADENAAEMLSTVVYGDFNPTSDKDITKCQKTVGKSTSAFYLSKSKALAKCQAGVLGGKITGPCPDSAADAAIQKAEDKKIASIAKACCGADGACGGGQCVGSPANVTVAGCTGAGTPAACCTGLGTGTCTNANCLAKVCVSGANAGAACTVASECPGGSCPGNPLPCCTGAGTGACAFNTDTDCEQTRNCFRCIAGPTIGAECQTNGECGAGGRCANGLCSTGTLIGAMCERNTDCPGTTCTGGANNGAACTTASQCPGGSCSGACDKTGTASLCVGGTTAGAYCLIDADCAGGGTCNKTGTAYCQSDDRRPVQDLGFVDPCPGINVGTGSIGGTVMGQTMASLLECVDGQAAQRADCQDKAGATFNPGTLSSGSLSQCGRVIDDCTSNGGTVTATVSIASTTAQLGGVSVSLGFPYAKVQLPGAGSDALPNVALQQFGFTSLLQASDAGDTVSIGASADVVNGEFYAPGVLFVVTFNTCGAAAVTSDFACVVQSASDTSGNALLSGVTCSVTVP